MTEDDRATRASEARSAYQYAVAQIRQDPNLSPEGRSRAIAREWVRAEKEISEAREEWIAQQDRIKASFEDRVLRPPKLTYGATPSEKIMRDTSFRDAIDRADRAESKEERLKMLRRARQSGDALMERAVVVVALDRQELAVLQDHVAAHPDEKDAVEGLVALTTTEAREQKIASQITFSKPALPRDAGGFTEGAVRRMAADERVTAVTE